MINIQLFTDGGSFKKGKISVSIGVMYVDRKKILTYEKVLLWKSSTFAELFAINKILSRAYGYCVQKNILDDDFYINIYTDSLTSIQTILSDKPRENDLLVDKIIYEIKDIISKFNNKVSFYHIKSHISGNNLKSSHHMFCEKNNINISFNEFLFIQQQNKKCDKIVAKEYKKYNKKMKIEENNKKRQLEYQNQFIL